MISEKQKQTLEIMKSNLTSAKDFYKPSDVLWKMYSNDFEWRLMNEGINDVQSQEFNKTFSLFSPFTAKLHYFHSSMWLLYNNIKKRDKFSLLEKTEALLTGDANLYFNPSSIIGRQESKAPKNLTWDYLISLDTILNIAEEFPEIISEPCVIGEIGAGWGRIGYFLLQINKKISYNIFDIPHTLLISQEFLRDRVSSNNIFDYETNNKIEKFDKLLLLNEPGIRFNLSCDIEKYANKSIDVFLSVATFQEMSFDQVNSYFDVIDKKGNYLYIQQRYKDLVMQHSLYPCKDNWNVMFDRDVTFHPLWFEKMFKIQ